MAKKPSIPKGTRDFTPAEVVKRNYITGIIRKHFETYGYQPIETPSFENLDTLMGKYGEEGDRLIFKILNSGEFAEKADEKAYASKDSRQLLPHITEKALRYDLTVPFARFVVMNQNALQFPFKRYQIQPVWRADRPQKGRFREFYQCDADVVGANSLLQEVEFVQLYDAVFFDLGLEGVTVKLNHRKVLSGIAEVIGAGDKLVDFTVALDKMDKIGEDGVVKEMLAKGISEQAVEKARPLFGLSGSNAERLDLLEEFLQNSEEGLQGVKELRFLLESLFTLGLKTVAVALDVNLARGLNYYTGTIFEVAAPEGVKMGSIGGGGRYDDLTGIFGLKDMSGVGISFGLDRIYLVLEELNLFPEAVDQQLKVLFINFGEKESMAAMRLTKGLREAGISAEVYPTAAKIQKQFKYADNRNVPYVVLIGEEELKQGNFVVKNMKSGDQQNFSVLQEFIDTLKAAP